MLLKLISGVISTFWKEATLEKNQISFNIQIRRAGVFSKTSKADKKKPQILPVFLQGASSDKRLPLRSSKHVRVR
jgi:hypothetical protein